MQYSHKLSIYISIFIVVVILLTLVSFHMFIMKVSDYNVVIKNKNKIIYITLFS